MAKIRDVFKYLKEFNELSNPVITEINKQKWYRKLDDIPNIKELWYIYDVMDFDNDKILEIQRPILSPCPLPEQIISNWIKSDWKNVSIDKVDFYEKKEEEIEDDNGNKISVEALFQEDPNRVILSEKWIKQRDAWREKEFPKKRGLDLYNALFKLYSDINKEAESVELILGDGRIIWNAEERFIDHPVFLQRVQLEFNAEKPSFVIRCDEIKTEVYTSMLRIINTINQSMLANVLKEVEKSPYHIADISNTKALFKRLINVIDKDGRYTEQYNSTVNAPIIIHEPVLFLRKRTLGFSTFIDKIIDDIDNKEEMVLPPFFNNMVGKHAINQNEELAIDNWNFNGMDKDILFTLPANNEQLKIVKYLNKFDHVLVQGPPGTGKTHTIANLIGHLLSQGNSVLVTSQTEKALTVLKEKVDKDLRSLCISLLSSRSQRKEMDSTLFDIAEKSTSLDLNQTKNTIEKLIKVRENLIDKYKTKNKELIKIRSLEYKDIVFDNETIKPIDAAKFINEGIGNMDYIPGETTDDTIGLPLSLEDLEFLYKTNSKISQEEEILLDKNIPDINSLWEIDTFKEKSNRHEELKSSLAEWRPIINFKDEISESEISSLLEQAVSIKTEFEGFDKFQYIICQKNINDSIYKTLWESVFNDFNKLLCKYEEWRKINFEDEIVISNELIKDEAINILDEIITTEKEKPVRGLNSIVKPKWKNIRDNVKVNNIGIDKREDYIKTKFVIEYELRRQETYNKMKKLIDEISENEGLPLENFEEIAKKLKIKVEIALNFNEKILLPFVKDLKQKYLVNDLSNNGVALDYSNYVISVKETLNDVIITDAKKYLNKVKYHQITKEWQEYIDFLSRYRLIGYPFAELIRAITNYDIENYEKHHRSLEYIYSKKELYVCRKNFIEKLRNIAPKWADDILERVGVHGGATLPDRIGDAWKWRQLSNQLTRLDNYDPNVIQRELEQINEALMKNAKALAYEKAWFEKIKNTTSKQTQAIEGLRITKKQIGKEKGKSVPRQMKNIRELMPICQTAIPIWIMSLNKVVENFDPAKNRFDVVIIDEASQANILALSALYLAKKIIIVGDDEQVSPNIIGIRQNEIDALIDQYLIGIPNNVLFNSKTSLYDMAITSGFKPLMLTEHFRCLPEIIEFSNQLSYNGKIKPLRDASGVKTVPPVLEYRVPDGCRNDKKVNTKEAEHIASLVSACIENEYYNDKTIGVISLLGEQQAYEIDKLLQKNLDPKEYEKRKILCGTAPQFQGDERDIIFLSVVEGPKEKGGPVMLVSEDGRNDMYRKRYNVAASRAKDQMWVVHSLNPEIDLKPDDLRLKLIRHAKNPSINKFESKLSKAESDFELQVMKQLLNRGYKVEPQWKVGAYRIDMVVEDAGNRIALECDGEKFHTHDDLQDDLKRQAILERLGWRFIRIRGSAYYRNPEETMEWVYSELDNYNIKPNYKEDEEKEIEDKIINEELKNDIKRRAEEIRQNWNAEDNSFDVESEIIMGDEEQKVPQENKIGNPIENEKEEKLASKQYVTNIATNPNTKAKEEAKIDTDSSQINVFNVNNNEAKEKKAVTFDFSKKNDKQNEKVYKERVQQEKTKANKSNSVSLKPLFDFTKKKDM